MYYTRIKMYRYKHKIKKNRINKDLNYNDRLYTDMEVHL